MAADIQGITQSNDVWPDQIYGYLQGMNAKLDQIEARQRSLDEALMRFMVAFSTGGARGIRQAAREHASGR